MPFYRNEDMSMKHKPYTRRTTRIDINTLVTTNEYNIPNKYKTAVAKVIQAYVSGLPFNRAVDRIAQEYKSLNRNTLAKHTLRHIANDY
jgi:hypothetical protein